MCKYCFRTRFLRAACVGVDMQISETISSVTCYNGCSETCLQPTLFNTCMECAGNLAFFSNSLRLGGSGSCVKTGKLFSRSM